MVAVETKFKQTYGGSVEQYCKLLIGSIESSYSHAYILLQVQIFCLEA